MLVISPEGILISFTFNFFNKLMLFKSNGLDKKPIFF